MSLAYWLKSVNYDQRFIEQAVLAPGSLARPCRAGVDAALDTIQASGAGRVALRSCNADSLIELLVRLDASAGTHDLVLEAVKRLTLKLPVLKAPHGEGDEVIYWSLAHNLVETGRYTLRGTEILRNLSPRIYDHFRTPETTTKG